MSEQQTRDRITITFTGDEVVGISPLTDWYSADTAEFAEYISRYPSVVETVAERFTPSTATQPPYEHTWVRVAGPFRHEGASPDVVPTPAAGAVTELADIGQRASQAEIHIEDEDWDDAELELGSLISAAQATLAFVQERIAEQAE